MRRARERARPGVRTVCSCCTRVAGIPSPLWCGVVEGIALGVYFLDIGALARVFGASHFKDKLWDSGFLVMALLCGLDWLLVYPCGLYSIARFSRPLRSLLLIAKLQVIRRLLATMLKTTPKMKDVVIVFVAFMFVYAVLGVQLFSGPDVRAWYSCAGGGECVCVCWGGGAPTRSLRCSTPTAARMTTFEDSAPRC